MPDIHNHYHLWPKSDWGMLFLAIAICCVAEAVWK